jgi:cytochrome c5
MKKRWIFGLVIVAILLAACSSPPQAPTLNVTQEPAAPVQITEPAVQPTEPPAPTAVVPTAKATALTTEPPALTTESPALDGRTLLENRCTTCHDITVIELKSESAEEWEQIVMQMIQNGAFLTSDEKTFLIEYLAETYPEK